MNERSTEGQNQNQNQSGAYVASYRGERGAADREKKQNKQTEREQKRTEVNRTNTHIAQHPPQQEPHQLTEDEQEGTKEVEPHWPRFVEDPEDNVCHDEEVDEGGSAIEKHIGSVIVHGRTVV
jgi:hypothetical protein